MPKITKNFTLEELTKTSHKQYNNTPSTQVVINLAALCVQVLQPARDFMLKPIFVHSGYRSPEVNKKVGGVKNSQHLVGQAADIDMGNREDNIKLFKFIKEYRIFDQLIDEKDYDWLHVSYNAQGGNRMQVLHLK